MVRKDEKYYRALTDEYKDLIICPKMNKEDFRKFLIRQYRLVPASAEQIGLCDVYDDFFGWVTENRLKPFCELTGTGYNPEDLKYELFESDIPVHEAGFLFSMIGRSTKL